MKLGEDSLPEHLVNRICDKISLELNISEIEKYDDNNFYQSISFSFLLSSF